MSTGLGSSKKGSRIADSSMVTQFRRVYAQGISDATYSSDLKKNAFRSSISVANTTAFGAAASTYGNITGSTSSSTPSVTIPDAPILDSLTSLSSSLIVAFTAPTNDGGSVITDYEYSIDSGSTYVSASTITSPFTISGLTNGTPYSVVIRAINSIGPSSDSNSLTETPDIEIQNFTTVGTTTWTAPSGVTQVDYLVVGGGGGGGGGHDNGGGGGGGGGMVLSGTVSVTPGTTYTVTVGSGGAASTNTYPTIRETAGGDGGDSVFASITSLGGNGGKGSRTQTGGAGLGGAAQISSSSAGVGGSGGGAGGSSTGGGGGGGSTSAGVNGTSGSGGAGGNGTSSAISGSAVTYGAGGSGAPRSTTSTGSTGTANRGNGGGGSGNASGGARNGSAGGSGIVVLSY